MATATQLLLPALLAMDVYHRDVEEVLFDLVNGLPLPDGVKPFGDVRKDLDIGFVAKAYEYKGTIYIAYRGTDDGSLDLGANGAFADHNKAGAERDLITRAAA